MAGQHSSTIPAQILTSLKSGWSVNVKGLIWTGFFLIEDLLSSLAHGSGDPVAESKSLGSISDCLPFFRGLSGTVNGKMNLARPSEKPLMQANVRL